MSLVIYKEFLVHISSAKNVLSNSLWQSNILQIQNINCTGKWCNICFPKSMHLSSINNHISFLRISEMQSNWFTLFKCLNDYSYWWLSTLLIHISVVVLPFCCLTEPDVLMYFASSLSHSSAAQGLWLMTTYSSQATGLYLSWHPFLFSLPLHPSKIYLLHTDIYAKSLFFGVSHSLTLTISASALLPCPHILCPSLAPYSTTTFSASHIYCHYLYLLASSPSLLFAQKIILFLSHKIFLERDQWTWTPLWKHFCWTFLVSLAHASAWIIYMEAGLPSYSFCFHLPTHHHHLMFSSSLIAISTLFPVTASPPRQRSLQLHSKPFSITSPFWVFLCNIYTINWPHSPSPLLLMNPCECTASLHFRYLLTFQSCHPLPQIQLLL